MAHLHNIYDSDIHFKLDSKTRTFSNETDLKLLVAQGDHNSERITFEIPRYIEQHDMLKCNRIEVHYINISSTTRDASKDVYTVEDAQVSPEDENVVEFSWLLSGRATQYNGTLSFAISMKCLTDEVIDYKWNTLTYEKILVGKSLNNAETIAQEYSDVLEKWKKEVLENINPTVTIDTELNEESDNAIANSTVTKKIGQLSDSIDNLKENGLNQNIDEAVANYLSENPISGGLTSTAKNLLITILRNSLYSNNQSENITALETALGESETVTTYKITNNLSNATNSNANTSITGGSSYSANISASDGYIIDEVIVTMGGSDVTSSVYKGGVINIPIVTGDIVVTVTTIQPTTTMYTITNTFTNVTSDNLGTSIEENGSYSAVLSVESGYTLDSVTVTMSGEDITSTAYLNNVVSISQVTGNVVITAIASQVQTQTETLEIIETTSYPNITTFEYTELESYISGVSYFVAKQSTIKGGILNFNFDTADVSVLNVNLFIFDNEGNPYKHTTSANVNVQGELSPTYSDVGTGAGFMGVVGPFSVKIPDDCTVMVNFRKDGGATSTNELWSTNATFRNWVIEDAIPNQKIKITVTG